MKRKLILVLIIFGLLVAGLFALRGKYGYLDKLNTEAPINVQIETKPKETPKVQLLEAANLDVPYVGQAPFANWKVHEESCEEAAVLMIHDYLEKIAVPNNIVPESAADADMRSMKAWEVKNYGSEPDLTMSTLGKFAKDYYGYNFEVKKSISEYDIKQAVSDGKAVIVPVMTHGLQNSMYGRETAYHVLLVKGYDQTGVFTNDAGVGNGINHHYNWDILWQAIDQQTVKMNQGRDMVTIYK